LIASCLIGTNIGTISGTTLMALAVTQAGLGPFYALLYIPVSVTLGEALPKTVFQYHATALAPVLSRPIGWAQTAFAPLLWVSQLWSLRLRRLIGAERDALTRADIVQIIEGGTGSIAPHEHRMITNLFWLREVTVEDCMTPLVEVHMLSTLAACGEAVELSVRSGHSRLPVYQDRVDNIVGVVNITDLLWNVPDDRPVDALMHRIRFVPESKRADDLLHDMRRNRERIVVVVDEYGGSVGIVTIEDLLEEFIGEIHDERDTHHSGIRRVGERSWRMPGRTEIEPLAAAIGRPIPEGDYDTVAGLLLARFGRIPLTGEAIEIDGLVFRVEEGTDRAIVSVHLTLRSPAG
jgi:CBS domain containing-hemolysin-like protein